MSDCLTSFQAATAVSEFRLIMCTTLWVSKRDYISSKSTRTQPRRTEIQKSSNPEPEAFLPRLCSPRIDSTFYINALGKLAFIHYAYRFSMMVNGQEKLTWSSFLFKLTRINLSVVAAMIAIAAIAQFTLIATTYLGAKSKSATHSDINN